MTTNNTTPPDVGHVYMDEEIEALLNDITLKGEGWWVERYLDTHHNEHLSVRQPPGSGQYGICMIFGDPDDDEQSKNIRADATFIAAAPAIIRQLRRERDAARAEIATDDLLLAERNRILDALPCPVHGPCVPYVLEFIERQKKVDETAYFAAFGNESEDA